MAKTCCSLPIKTIYQRLTDGDGLTDTEVNRGAAFFKRLSADLSAAGPIFRIAFLEANRVYLKLDDMQAARREAIGRRPRRVRS